MFKPIYNNKKLYYIIPMVGLYEKKKKTYSHSVKTLKIAIIWTPYKTAKKVIWTEYISTL